MEPCALGDRRGKTGVCYPAGAAAMATRPPPKPTIGSSRSFLGLPQSSRPFPTRCTFRCTHSLLRPPLSAELSRLLLCLLYVVVPLAPATSLTLSISLSIYLSLFFSPPLARCFSLEQRAELASRKLRSLPEEKSQKLVASRRISVFKDDILCLSLYRVERASARACFTARFLWFLWRHVRVFWRFYCIYILLYCNVMIQILNYGISYRKNWYLFFFRNVHIEGQYIGLFVDNFLFFIKITSLLFFLILHK